MQRVQGNPDAFFSAILETQRAVEKKRCAVLQLHSPVPESLHPDLGALQIAQQADIALALVGRRTKLLGAAPVFGRIAVRKIQARDIEPRVDHLAQRLLAVGRRPQRRHDLCPSVHGGDYCTLVCRSYCGSTRHSLPVTRC